MKNLNVNLEKCIIEMHENGRNEQNYSLQASKALNLLKKMRIFVVLIALMCFIVKVRATDYGIITFSTTYNASITSSNTSDSYTVVLPKPGKLDLRLTSPGGTAALPDNMADVKWINASNNEVLRTTNGGFTFPHNDYMDVEAGNYIIEVVQISGLPGNTGNYSIRIVCSVDEVEPNNTMATAQVLPWGYTVNGTITSSDIDVYKYILTEPGSMTMNVTRGTLTDMYVRWYDADGNQIHSTNFWTGTYNQSMNLEPDTYYVAITPYNSNNSGTYNLYGSFVRAGNNEIEPNETFLNSQLLTSAQTAIGFISYQDRKDTYRFELQEPGIMTVNVTRGTLTDMYVRWYNSDGDQIHSTNYWTGTYNQSMNLEPDTYYVEITPYSSGNSGTYNLSVNFTSAGNNEIEPNETRANAQFLESGQTVKGFISHQDRKDMYRYELADMNMTVNVIRLGLTDMYVRWYDADGNQIHSTNYWTGTYNQSMNLVPGTYYVEITPYSSGYSGTYNLTIFTNTAPTVSVESVNVTPSNFITQNGFTQTFTATVTGINVGSSQGVTWSVTGNNTSETTISNSGALTIATDETATSLTVIATSTVNTSISGSANVIVKSPPIIILQPTDGVVDGDGILDLSVTATGAAPLTYQWYRATNPNNNGGTAVGTNSSTFSVPTTTAGTFYYYVTISNSDGSVTSRPATITVTGDVGIWHLTNETNSIIIYPNPANNVLYVKFSSDKEIDYTIYNLVGNAVIQGRFRDGETINIEQLPSGVYGLHTDEGMVRFVKL
ncbi:MAG: T9SS type A sorting domain-containing protein [Marinilabiliaceae bacterium]|nr:T9SS type A sorting domain-containing protein [Marinilabiliaceae bacterium]